MTVKVGVVEDDREVREAWRQMVEEAPGYECVGAYGSGEEALAALPARRPDVVLMDLNLPNMTGVECTALLRSELPSLQILVLTVCEDVDLIFRALCAGANGYLLKRSAPTKLLAAIRDITLGGAPINSEIARKLIECFRTRQTSTQNEAELSRRESEILDLLARGYANKEIAEHLSISFDTVRTHLKKVYEKLHVRSRTEAVAWYFRHNNSAVASPARLSKKSLT